MLRLNMRPLDAAQYMWFVSRSSMQSMAYKSWRHHNTKIEEVTTVATDGGSKYGSTQGKQSGQRRALWRHLPDSILRQRLAKAETSLRSVDV